jgi:hypothetical protein
MLPLLGMLPWKHAELNPGVRRTLERRVTNDRESGGSPERKLVPPHRGTRHGESLRGWARQIEQSPITLCVSDFGYTKGTRWRSRKDPFEHTWLEVRSWVEVEPDLTGRALLQRLQAHYPVCALTLQRRLKQRRVEMARGLILGIWGRSQDGRRAGLTSASMSRHRAGCHRARGCQG